MINIVCKFQLAFQSRSSSDTGSRNGTRGFRDPFAERFRPDVAGKSYFGHADCIRDDSQGKNYRILRENSLSCIFYPPLVTVPLYPSESNFSNFVFHISYILYLHSHFTCYQIFYRVYEVVVFYPFGDFVSMFLND